MSLTSISKDRLKDPFPVLSEGFSIQLKSEASSRSECLVGRSGIITFEKNRSLSAFFSTGWCKNINDSCSKEVGSNTST